MIKFKIGMESGPDPDNDQRNLRSKHSAQSITVIVKKRFNNKR